MSHTFKKTIGILFAVTVSSALFFFGVSHPLDTRVSGDALEYLRIADSLSDFNVVMHFTGNRTLGFPLFERVIYEFLALFHGTVYVLPWINTIGLSMLGLHIAASWLFSVWVQRNGLIRGEDSKLLLFVVLATFPALIGHTTTPLADTLALDLVLFGLFFLDCSFRVNVYRTCVAHALFSAFFFGFAILVRPASMIGLAVAVAVGWLVSVWEHKRSMLSLSLVMLGAISVLLPSLLNCTQRFGTLCIQSPSTFNPMLSAQDGLRGARVLWTLPNDIPGSLPMLTDDSMFRNYYEKCQLRSFFGMTPTSFTGCLLAEPGAIPGFLLKKWIGLFDYFRFTAYMETTTPPWLRVLSRAYGAIGWLGFCLSFIVAVGVIMRGKVSTLKEYALQNLGVLLLVVYSTILLAQHTVLHTEERYGFPLLPLSVAVFFMIAERATRIAVARHLFALVVFCLAVIAVYVFQTLFWDKAAWAGAAT